MLERLARTPERKSGTVLVLAIVLGVAGFALLRVPGYRLESLPSALGWLTPAWVDWFGLGLLAAAAVVLLVGCLLWFPEALVPASLRPTVTQLSATEFMTAQNDLRATLVNALAGLLLLATAMFTWQQLVISREAQVTERFTRAVELLGNTDIAVRAGAVHSLGRLAVDSRQDDRSIYSLLAAYIRSHSPKVMLGPSTAWRQRLMCEQGHAGYGSLQKCAADLQSALGVLADHPDVLSDGRAFTPLLVDTRLPGVACGHAKLAGADLRGALLDSLDCRTKADPYANFEGADFRGASLRRAQFGRANLRGARLENANLTGAELGLADLQGATYNNATVFPAGFDAIARGLRVQLDET
jgi:hypothetical protein